MGILAPAFKEGPSSSTEELLRLRIILILLMGVAGRSRRLELCPGTASTALSFGPLSTTLGMSAVDFRLGRGFRAGGFFSFTENLKKNPEVLLDLISLPLSRMGLPLRRLRGRWSSPLMNLMRGN
jgi:hypothetical protein